tara:strand:- start:218 stop:394 length:177 start_codon:yes stop_codon:yes gene_type:complete
MFSVNFGDYSMVKGLTNDVNKKVGFFRKIFWGMGLLTSFREKKGRREDMYCRTNVKSR